MYKINKKDLANRLIGLRSAAVVERSATETVHNQARFENDSSNA